METPSPRRPRPRAGSGAAQRTWRDNGAGGGDRAAPARAPDLALELVLACAVDLACEADLAFEAVLAWVVAPAFEVVPVEEVVLV